jgi:hypothetical protein
MIPKPPFLVILAVDLLGEEAVRLELAISNGQPASRRPGGARLPCRSRPALITPSTPGARSGDIRPALIGRLVAPGGVPIHPQSRSPTRTLLAWARRA